MSVLAAFLLFADIVPAGTRSMPDHSLNNRFRETCTLAHVESGNGNLGIPKGSANLEITRTNSFRQCA